MGVVLIHSLDRLRSFLRLPLVPVPLCRILTKNHILLMVKVPQSA